MATAKTAEAGAAGDGSGGVGGVSGDAAAKSVEDVALELEESQRRSSALEVRVEQLEALVAGKEAEIKSMAEYLESERGRHAMELKLVLTERDKNFEDLEHEREVARAKIKGLEAELTGYNDIQAENERLTARVGELMNEMDSSNYDYAQTMQQIKSDSFKLRMMLEQKFRKSLEELDAKYREEAFQEIDKESKQALVDNSKLQEELAIQSIGIDKLLKKYKKTEAMLTSSKLEREMLEKEVELQVQSISRLKKRCMQSEAKLEQAKSSASERRLAEVAGASEVRRLSEASAKVVEEEARSAQKEVARYKGLYQKAQARAKTWKARTFELSQKLLDQQVKYQRLEKAGAGATSSSPFAGMDHDGETAGEGSKSRSAAAEQLRAINDVKSMWNSKAFPKPDGGIIVAGSGKRRMRTLRSKNKKERKEGVDTAASATSALGAGLAAGAAQQQLFSASLPAGLGVSKRSRNKERPQYFF